MSVERVFSVTEKQKLELKSLRNEKDVLNDIKALRQWLQKQPHLPSQQIDDDFLKKMLRLNKHSLEKTKKKIDTYFSCKSLVPEFFFNRNPLEEQQRIWKYISMAPLPKLCDDLSRIVVFRIENLDIANYEPELTAKYTFMLFDFHIRYDQTDSETFIIDFSNFELALVKKFTPVFVKKCATILIKAYSDRIKGIHMLFIPSYAVPLMNLIQMLLKDKIAGRIQPHTNLKSLHESISKRNLPSDYEGEQKPLQESFDEWKEFTNNNSEWIIKQGNLRSNEALRVGNAFEEDFFGSVHGSFRTLSVD